MTQTLDTALVDTWFDAWARSRGYQTDRRDGRRAALRSSRPVGAVRTDESAAEATAARQAQADLPETWEHVLVEPDDQDLSVALDRLRERPGQLLTVFGQARADLEAAGLREACPAELLMAVEMDPEVQDVEPPLTPEGLRAELDEPVEGSRRVRIWASGEGASTLPEGEDELAALGWVTFEGETAVYDRIWTAPQHRRRGLGSLVMRHLTSEAMTAQLSQGLLVASPDGQKLYGHLGWREVAPVRIHALNGQAQGSQAEHTGTMGR